MLERDLLAILDQLEMTITNAHHVPLTNRVILDEDQIFEQIDRLRAAIPEAFHQAQRVTRERDRILSQTREEGESIIKEAESYAEKLVKESTIVQKAQEEADRILAEARQMSREVRLGARNYADELLERLENHLTKALQYVHQGREQLGATRDLPGPAEVEQHEAQ